MAFQWTLYNFQPFQNSKMSCFRSSNPFENLQNVPGLWEPLPSFPSSPPRVRHDLLPVLPHEDGIDLRGAEAPVPQLLAAQLLATGRQREIVDDSAWFTLWILKIAIYSWYTHWKWWFYTVILAANWKTSSLRTGTSPFLRGKSTVNGPFSVDDSGPFFCSK